MSAVVDSWEELCPQKKGKRAKKEKKEPKPVVKHASGQRERKKPGQSSPPCPVVKSPPPLIEPEVDLLWESPPPAMELLDLLAVPQDGNGHAIWEPDSKDVMNSCTVEDVSKGGVDSADHGNLQDAVKESWEDMCDSDADTEAAEAEAGHLEFVPSTQSSPAYGHVPEPKACIAPPWLLCSSSRRRHVKNA